MKIERNLLRQLIIEALVNAYEVLGLKPGASDDEIKHAWRRLAAMNHPDRGGSHGQMVDINVARDRLLNKNDLARRGPTFNGYESPQAASEPKSTKKSSQSSDAQMFKCNWCGRTVAAQRGTQPLKFVNHYTQENGSTKCNGSGMPVLGRQNDEIASVLRPNVRMYNRIFLIRQSEKLLRRSNLDYVDVEVIGPTVYVHRHKDETSKFSSARTSDYAEALRHVIDLARSAQQAGYISVAPPFWVTSSPQEHMRGSEKSKETSGGSGPTATKDTYKVYGWKGHRRVVRVRGKLYGTETGGRLKSGGVTKFNANDRARVKPVGDKMNVTKTDSDHTQSWDPIDEVRSVIDDLVIESLLVIR